MAHFSTNTGSKHNQRNTLKKPLLAISQPREGAGAGGGGGGRRSHWGERGTSVILSTITMFLKIP